MPRRTFLAAGTAGAASLPALVVTPEVLAQREPVRRDVPPDGPVVISSGNGIPAVDAAMTALRDGAAPVDAVVAGVTVVEDDPNDMSVGYGGLPNEDGVVELDASVMDGPSHKAGAVAALRGIRNPAQVALRVLRRTDHVLLVGEGALRFARAMGFEEQDLLTDRAREAWLRWKTNLNQRDDWLDDDQRLPEAGVQPGAAAGVPFTWGTIHCAAVDARGDLGACTTTSGLSYKIPGRVGDSPIIGAGMFVDNTVGAAGATGRGEAVIQSCGAFQVVRHMADGLEPTEACLRVLRWIAEHTRRPDLLDDRGRPNFEVTLYALRRDGVHGSATMLGARQYAVHDETGSRLIECAAAFG